MTPLSIALQGIGRPPLHVALQGFVVQEIATTGLQGFGSYPQPKRPRLTPPPRPGRRPDEVIEFEEVSFLAGVLQELLN